MIRTAAVAVLAMVALAVPLRAQDPFYTSLLRRGLADAQQGNWQRAATELRLAAFGLVDNLPQYETAHVVGAVANERMGHAADAKVAAEKVVLAERITPSYARLPIDAATRSAFEAIL